MRVPSHHRRSSAAANMTPMIDVVFLLIIFFLVSSHLARQETRLPVDLPVAATHAPNDPEKAALTITVNTQAQVLLSGNVVSSDQLETALRQWRSQQGANAAIRIRTDGTVQYRYVQPILRSAALAGVTDAAIAVRQEESR